MAPSALVTVISSPPTVVSTVLPAGISPALTETGNTCRKRTAVRASLSSNRPPSASAGLVETLSGEGTFTVFAPNNDAFAKVPAEALGGLLEDKEALTAVLLRHVL